MEKVYHDRGSLETPDARISAVAEVYLRFYPGHPNRSS
jgi:hypothetical protein